VPFVLKIGIIIDPVRRSERLAAVSATCEHHVGRASPARYDAGEHVNVVISSTTRTVNCQERLPAKPYSIYPALSQITTHVHWGHPVKRRRLVSDLRIAGTKAPKLVRFSAQKQIAVTIHVESSPLRRVRNINRSLPGNPAAISRPVKLSAVTTKGAGPKLILESVTRTAGPIDREPFLISSMPRAALGPSLTAVCRGPDVIAEKR